MFDDDGRLYVIASIGRRARHIRRGSTTWSRIPTVTVEHGGETYDATASVVPDDEHDDLYARIVERMPQFGEYQDEDDPEDPVVERVLDASS